MQAREKSLSIRPVILSGGSGTRLWPISRSQYPKQFAPLLNDESLFAATLKRVADRSRYAAPVIICNSEHKFFVLEALDHLEIKDATVLLEPVGRNTAAAALVAALYEKEPGVLHLVMPSDHLVADEASFHATVAQAAKAAASGSIVLFGITPDYPETGYGYIIPAAGKDADAVRKISLFSEKPDTARAGDLIKKGALWNSGIFLYAPQMLCKEAEALASDHFEKCAAAVHNATQDHRCILLGRDDYESMHSHAFDTLIMEHTKHGAVLPCSMGWNDVGSWQALWQLAGKDANSNACLGPVVAKDVKTSYIRSEGPAVAVLGMEDCLIVATKDAVLVAPRARAQEIKGLLSTIEDSHKQVATTHVCVPRPWGTYENIAEGTNFKVKHIVVKPGRSLSLQMHHHRAEHWVVVAGTARVECDGVEKMVFPNESIFVPKGATHRLGNPGRIDLQLIEVQSGDYLGEDDIVRFDDVYGRVSSSA
jgi:mannose-1-phosphate guanylyltransferase / mannose-6-phosphate isomerase